MVNIAAILCALVGVLIGVVVLTTRHEDSTPTCFVRVVVVPEQLSIDAYLYEFRFVAVSLCKVAHRVQSTIPPYFTTPVGRECVPILDTRTALSDGGCISNTDYVNLNVATFTSAFVGLVPVDNYTHISIIHEPVVRVNGSVTVPGTETKLYTQPCGFTTCTRTCTSPACTDNTCTQTNSQVPQALKSYVDLSMYTREVLVPFNVVPVLSRARMPNQLVLAYNLRGALQAHPSHELLYGLTTNSDTIAVQPPAFSAYEYDTSAVVTIYTATIGTTPTTATCTGLNVTGRRDDYPQLNLFAGGTAIFTVTKNSVDTVLACNVIIEADQYTYPVYSHAITQRDTMLDVTQIMHDGTRCTRLANIVHANATLSTTASILVGAHYYPLVHILSIAR